MSDDLSLLFKLRADNAQAKSALAETRAAVTQLRTSFGSDFAAMQTASKSALSDIGNNLNLFVGERIPLVGGAFVRLTENLHGLHDEMKKGGPEVERLAKQIESIAQSSGKSTHEVTTFLTSFVQLENQAKRDAAAIEAFGAATAQKLIPQLEKAGTELSNVAASSEAAGEGIASMAGPIGIAVLAIGAVAAAGGVLGAKFFELVHGVTEFEGKMLDLSQQTGVNVETLSAFEILAKTTGGSIETITASLGIFQKHLESAQDPTSKESKLLKDLKVDTADTDVALRDVLKSLAAMPEGFHQTATALELFGRGGKSILAIIKEMGGDLDGAIAKFREMGVIISAEDAKAADEFNDTLAILQFQVRGVTALIAKDAIPVILDSLKELSTTLKDNREAINAIGTAAGFVASLFTGKLRESLGAINAALALGHPYLTAAAALYERIASAGQTIVENAPGVGASASLSVATTAGDTVGGSITGGLGPHIDEKALRAAKKVAEEAFKAAIERSAEAAKQEAEIQRHLTEQLQLEHERGLQDLNAYYRQRQTLVDDHLADVKRDVEREQEAVRVARASGLVKDAEIEKKAAELKQRAREAQNKRDEETNKLTLERDRALVQAEVKLREQQFAIDQAVRDGEQRRVEDALKLQAITESEAIARQLEFLRDAQEQRIGIITFELNAQTTTAARKAQLDAEKTTSEQRYTDEVKRLTNERIDAMAREDVARENLTVRTPSDRENAKAAGDAANRGAAEPPLLKYSKSTISAIDQLGIAINKNLSGSALTAANAGLQAMVETFGQLGQAVGNVVQSFVLYGSAGTSVRKVTAEILAGVAQQAAVKAVFELAEGFAALALAFFGLPNAGPSAQAHFTAAAIYGGIAGVAAAAGRVVAGGSFQQGASGGTGGGSAGGSSPQTRAQPTTTEINRQVGSQASPTITLVVEHHIDDGATARSWIKSYTGGAHNLRDVVKTDGRKVG